MSISLLVYSTHTSIDGLLRPLTRQDFTLLHLTEAAFLNDLADAVNTGAAQACLIDLDSFRMIEQWQLQDVLKAQLALCHAPPPVIIYTQRPSTIGTDLQPMVRMVTRFEPTADGLNNQFRALLKPPSAI